MNNNQRYTQVSIADLCRLQTLFALGALFCNPLDIPLTNDQKDSLSRITSAIQETVAKAQDLQRTCPDGKVQICLAYAVARKVR